MLITEDEREDWKFRKFVLLCEASLKQESFIRHVDRVFENYVFSHEQRINKATKAILYNCMTCEGDFSYDFNNKIWVRDTGDRYAFNEAMRKFNKIITHDKRFRGRTPWVVRNVKEYFKMKLVKKYYNNAKKPATPPVAPTSTDKGTPTDNGPVNTNDKSRQNVPQKAPVAKKANVATVAGDRENNQQAN